MTMFRNTILSGGIAAVSCIAGFAGEAAAHGADVCIQVEPVVRIALSAKLHFVYASPNIRFYDMDTCMLGHKVDPCVGGVIYDGYLLDIDDAVGIGADADEAFLEGCEKWVIDHN